MVAVRSVGLHLTVAFEELAVVPGALRIGTQLDAGQRRGVGNVEGECACLALARDRRRRDAGRSGVEGEVVAHLLSGGRRSIRGCLEG